MVGADVYRWQIGAGAEQGFDTLQSVYTVNLIATLYGVKVGSLGACYEPKPAPEL